MRILSIAVASLAVIVMLFASVIALNEPKTPPAMASVVNALNEVDFSTLPEESRYTARDGALLSYRTYPGASGDVVLLIHGSSARALTMHGVAEELRKAGATVHSLSMRGHDGTGRSGDVDYVGQLEDDIADFVETLGEKAPGERRILVGFSSGGGFALRVAGSQYGALFDRYVFVSPFLRHDAPTTTWNGGSWSRVAIPRIIGLSLLDSIGIERFGGLRVLAFALPPDRHEVMTPFYSYRMMKNFAPHDDYKADLAKAPAPVALVVGEDDEIFDAAAFAPLLKPVRPDLDVTIVPGVDHVGVTAEPEGVAAIAAAALARE